MLTQGVNLGETGRRTGVSMPFLQLSINLQCPVGEEQREESGGGERSRNTLAA